jgi:hypothetical protein
MSSHSNTTAPALTAKATTEPPVNIGGRKSRRYKKSKGGSGAAEYAEKVYGTQQQSSSGNQIQMHQVTGGRKGGNVLGDIAVPAVLLYANHTYGKNKPNPFTGPKTFRRKNKSSRRNRSFRRRR